MITPPQDRTILVVEDDTEFRGFLIEALEKHGYKVSQACDGEEALQLTFRDEPTMIIADVVMPRASGFSLLQALRKDPRTRNLPVILISGMGDRDFIRKGMSLGADDYLTKPFGLDELLSTIEIRFRRLENFRSDPAAPPLPRLSNLPDVMRNPLNAILGITHLLRERARRSERIEATGLLEDLDNIDDAGRQLIDITERILLMEELLDLATLDSPAERNKRVAELLRPFQIDQEAILCTAGYGIDPTRLCIDVQPGMVLAIPDFLNRALVELFTESGRVGEGIERFTVEGGPVDGLYQLAVTANGGPAGIFSNWDRHSPEGDLPVSFSVRVLALVARIQGGSISIEAPGTEPERLVVHFRLAP